MKNLSWQKMVGRFRLGFRFVGNYLLGTLFRLLRQPGSSVRCFQKALSTIPFSGVALKALIWAKVYEAQRQSGNNTGATLGNIYFVERFTDLKVTLTTFKKGGGLSIFFVLDQDHFVALFSRLFPSDVVVPMRQINIRPPEPDDPEMQNDHTRELARWRRCYRRVFSSLPRHVDAYFTCFDGRLNLMMIADILIRRGHGIFSAGRALEAQGKPSYEKRVKMISSLPLEGRSPYLVGLSEASGLPLVEDPEAVNKAVRQYVSTDPATWPQPIVISKRNWPDLIREFPLEMDLPIDPSAVLYLEFPLYQIKGFNREKTRRNILDVLEAVVAKGHTLHIKPHPMGPDHLMTNGTPLESSPAVRVWPVEIPVEYIVDKFAHVLSFGTSTIFLEFPGRKVVLRDLLVVKDNEGVKRVAGFDRDLARVHDIDERLTPETYAQAIADWPDPR